MEAFDNLTVNTIRFEVGAKVPLIGDINAWQRVLRGVEVEEADRLITELGEDFVVEAGDDRIPRFIDQ